MKHRMLLAALAAALAAPLAVQAAPLEERPPAPAGAAATKNDDKAKSKADKHHVKAELEQAERQCAALRKQLGKTAFAATYPTMKACLAARVQAERAHRTEAKTECEAKLGKRADPKRVAACTAKSAAEDSAEERTTVVNAAKACADELAADPSGFRAEYGAKHNLASAFGKCVSAKASGEDEDEDDEHEDEDEDDEDEHEDEK